jgi:exo-1,4-beta-D-glucosaminidase
LHSRWKISGYLALVLAATAVVQASTPEVNRSLTIGNWFLQTSVKVTDSGEALSTPGTETRDWITAVVPGTVLGSLSKAKIVPDPDYGVNLRNLLGKKFDNVRIQADTPMDSESEFFVPWWYRAKFSVPEDLKGQVLWLHFGGINYRADIWLNGYQITQSTDTVGTWRVYDFNVTKWLEVGGENAIAVRVYPPVKSYDLALSFVDWNPGAPDRYMGLFREVSIVSSGPIAIRNPTVVSHLNLPDTSSAQLTVATRLVNGTDKPQSGILQGTIGDLQFSQQFDLGPKETRDVAFGPGTVPQLNIKNPRLWWPAQMGTPTLHSLKLQFSVHGMVSDKAQIRFGIRQISSELDSHDHLLFRINGKKILIRGGGWTLDLMVPKSKDKLEREFEYVENLGLNTIRLEGMFETEDFFDLADEKGILVMAGWSCSLWESWAKWGEEQMRVADESLRSQMLRLRSHPSLLVWLNGSDGPPPSDVETKYLNLEREYLWPNPILSSAIETPSDVTGPSGVKQTGPYEYVVPEFFMHETTDGDGDRGGASGFNTETGPGPAIPPLETLREIFPTEHLWPIDDWWTFHAGLHDFRDLHVLIHSLNERYGEPSNLDDFLMKAQAMRYEAVRSMYEGYSRNKYSSATGVVIWMLNNSWPSMIWNLYDYHLRTSGGYFGAKIALEGVHPLYGYDDNSISVVNSQYQDAHHLKVVAQIYDLDMKERFSRQENFDAPADSSSKVFTLPEIKDLTPVYFLRLSVTDDRGKLVGSNFYWLPNPRETVSNYVNRDHAFAERFADFRALQGLPKMNVEATSRTTQEHDRQVTHVTLRNNSRSLAFFITLKLFGCGDNDKDILPVLWSDNYISLLPGETRELTARFLANPPDPVRVGIAGWNVNPSSVGCPAHPH